MVQRKSKPPVVTPELAQSIGSTFRVFVDPNASGPTLAEVLAQAPRIKGPPIVLAPQGQLDGALAQIIRDPKPDAQYPAIVVLGEETLTDELSRMAQYILEKDTKFIPNPESRRVISIMPNQLLRLQTNGTTQWQRPNIYVMRVMGTAADLHRRAVEARSIDIDGIGEAKLVKE